MKKLFGTDGMRGEAGKFPLDATTVETVGRSLAEHLRGQLGRPPLIVVGRDTRESGAWIEREVSKGVASAGAELRSAGVITTPGVAYLARALSADAGIVISASHNPYQDNGLKLFAPLGKKLDEQTERLIEKDIFSSQSQGPEKAPNSTRYDVDSSEREQLQQRYLNFLTDEVGAGLSLKGLSIVVDCANGAATTLAPALLARLGAGISAINNSPDGRNINLNCGSLHMEQLQREVVERGADLGVAFDGDADRALFVDDRGDVVNGDGTLWLLANYLHTRQRLKADTVIATVMSNIGLELALQSRGIKLIRTDVGDKYVLDELLRTGASLGGEQSGHIILPKLSLAGDGMITTLSVLRAMTEEKQSVRQLAHGLKTFPQVLVNVKVKRKLPFEQFNSLVERRQQIEKLLGSSGRLLLRYSGTEPLARVMLEGESQSQIESFAHELAAEIRRVLG
ncbi:MAG TPA: phosphoglucosamine mutase [Pyrinomonadaceae bacterium]|nr:phosphoglucosamine mutase [Pyrinomonadaceae bacterium]